jgi:MFS family permease
MAAALGRLGTERALVVSSADGLDEFSVSGPTRVVELRDGGLSTYDVTPDEVDLEPVADGAVGAGTPEQNALVLREVLAGSPGTERSLAVLNGGAAIYVAEHSPDDRRGFNTAWIQTTATVGLVLALAVIGFFRITMGDAAFREYGWRIPFILSAVLVVLALIIRLRLQETPLFSRLKSEGKSSTSPWRDSFGNAPNRKLILLALFGATAGQAVVWYQGQFQALFFMQNILGLSFSNAYLVVGVAIVFATPFFIFFGRLSDRVGRKPIILAGCALGALTYVPIYQAMLSAAPSADNYNAPVLTLLVFIQVLYVTMVYGPIAAFLVELFPGRVRYTSLSLPYHIGNGVFGGLVPVTSTYLVQRFDNPLAGLSYPIIVAVITFFVGLFFVRETNLTRIYDEVEEAQPLEGATA